MTPIRASSSTGGSRSLSASRGFNPDRSFLLLFVLLAVEQAALIAFTPFGLSPDEAHYWEWSRHLDYAYYSKGPFVAWAIAASTKLFGDTPFAVRLPALLCYSLAGGAFFLFVRKLFGAYAAFIAWLAFASMLIFAQAGFLMTTDAPALLFWILALACGYYTAFERRPRFYILFALAVGLGVWSKYTIAFLYPALVGFLFFTPGFRRDLLRKEFILGLLVFALLLLPILFWNSSHGWVNFTHNAGHLVKRTGLAFKPWYFPELLLGQAALTGPLLFFGLCYALLLGAKALAGSFRGNHAEPLFLYFTWSCLPLFCLVLVVSLFKRVYANWPMPIYVGALLALVFLITKTKSFPEKYRRLIPAALALSFLITIVGQSAVLGLTYGLPRKMLPTKKLVGWDILGQRAGEILEAQEAKGHRLFLLTDDYGVASLLSFYVPGNPHSYCANVGGRRMNQYDIWDTSERWAELRDRDALVIVQNEGAKDVLSRYFKRLRRVSKSPLLIDYKGQPSKHFYFYIGQDFTGEPGPAAQPG